MKFLVVFLAGALLFQATTANPFFFDIGKGVANTAGGMAQAGIGIAGSIADGFVQAGSNIAQAGINTATGIGQGVVQGAQGFAVNSLDAFKNITSAFGNQVNLFNNKTLTDLFAQAKNGLKQLENTKLSLLELAQRKLDESWNKTYEAIQNSENDLYAWAEEEKAKLEGASDDKRQEGEDTIDGFVEEMAAELRSCAESSVQPIEEMNNSTHNFIQTSFNTLNDFINNIQQCAQIPLSDKNSTSSCVSSIKSKLPAVAALPVEALRIKLQLEKAAVGKVSEYACFGKTMASIEEGKRQIAQEVENLLSA